MRINGGLFGVFIALTGGCRPSPPARPTTTTRAAAAIALGTQSSAVKFTTRGKDQEILVVVFPHTGYEACEPRALEAMVRMRPDPDRFAEPSADRDVHIISTGDLANDTRGLMPAFKVELTPELKARMAEFRRLVLLFERVECATAAGVTIGVPIP
jgi:hypothetical protein